MKKVIEQVLKPVEQTVCDICESKSTPISWQWQTSCPYDNCSSDWGEANFCSLGHFMEGVRQAKLGVTSNEDFSFQSFTLRMNGEATSELTAFVALLEKASELKTNL